MICNENEHNPEEIVDDLDVLHELEAQDVYGLAGDEQGQTPAGARTDTCADI